MDALAITLFGRFQLCYRGSIVDTIATPRQQALIAYLLLHRGAPADRGQLAFLFWPETSEKQARSNLRTLLYRVRALLPDADRFIQLDRATVGWRSDASIVLDVADFEAALLLTSESGTDADRIGSFEHTLDLYDAPLLPHLYDDWLVPHRERLQAGYLNALHHLIDHPT